MEENLKCPICGAPGISNYRKQKVICHVCDTDLSPYMYLAEGGSAANKSTIIVAESENKLKSALSRYRRLMFTIAILVLAIMFLVGVAIYLFRESTHNKALLCEAQNQIEQLDECLQALNAQNDVSNTIVLTEFKYVVRKGDSFWTISKRFWGTGEYAGKIASDNDLTIRDTIHIGDVLLIKN